MSIEADIVELLQALDNYIPGENDDCVADRIKESASAIRKLRAERDAMRKDARDEIEALKNRILLHERLQARVVAALGLVSWQGDLADAVALVRKRADALAGTMDVVGWQYRMDDGGWCFAEEPDAEELTSRKNIDRFRPVFAGALVSSQDVGGDK